MKGSGGRTAGTVSLCALAALFLFLSCTTTGPELPELTGSWAGSNNQLALTLTLTEGRFGDVSGTGTLNTGTSAFPLIVEGEHRHPMVSLVMRLSEEEEIRLDGTLLEGAAIDGAVDGLGFNRVGIIVSRLATGSPTESEQ